MTKTNAELELDVTEELAWDPKVDSEEIAVAADGGTVTLRGTVGSFRQKREARKAAERVYGVLYDVYLTSPTPYAGDVKDSIRKAMKRDAKLDAENIDVETVNGTAVLTGTVRSWAEHDSAVQAAWAAPGVTNVNDRLDIVY